MKVTVSVDDRTFEVEIADLAARPVRATVDGQTFSVWPEGESEESAVSTALAKPSAPTSSTTIKAAAPRSIAPETAGLTMPSSVVVTAPIPGIITAVSIKAGDNVTTGQELCVLEAMKMKNYIRAPRAGKIENIHVTVGQQVRQRQILMEYTAS